MLKACSCQQGTLARIKRSWWMRLFFPKRRLYQCGACSRAMLIPSQIAFLRIGRDDDVKPPRAVVAP